LSAVRRTADCTAAKPPDVDPQSAVAFCAIADCGSTVTALCQFCFYQIQKIKNSKTKLH